MLLDGSKKEVDDSTSFILEVTVGIEPTLRVLQTRALPLGYVTIL